MSYLLNCMNTAVGASSTHQFDRVVRRDESERSFEMLLH
jgi:hypothetical protein